MGATEPIREPIRLDRTFVRDTASAYAALGVDAPPRPVVMPDGVPGWLVTRYADARALLDDRRLSKDHAGAGELFPPEAAGMHRSPLAAHMLNTDPPDHTRLRRLIMKAFTGRAIARLRPRIEEITTKLLADLASVDGPVDLQANYSFLLPVAVICELLGVPEHDRDQFNAWAKAFTGGIPDEVGKAVGEEAEAYLADLVAAKRARPTPDLLSDLVQVSDDGDRLSEQELVAMAFLLLVAGHETSVNLIGNGMLALLRHPEQLAALRADPALLPGAVEEFLRYDGPVHIATTRFTVEPVRVAGVEIPAGQFVLISLLAANRDATKYPDPQRFDIARQTSGHVAFGYGIHHCVGAPLARLEGEIAIGGLLRTFDKLELAADPAELTWRGSQLIHGLHRLPVRLG